MKLSLLPLCLAFCISRLLAGPPSGSPDLLAPASGVLFGAYADFGDTEDRVTLEGIEGFEKLAVKPPSIIASSSYWG